MTNAGFNCYREKDEKSSKWTEFKFSGDQCGNLSIPIPRSLMMAFPSRKISPQILRFTRQARDRSDSTGKMVPCFSRLFSFHHISRFFSLYISAKCPLYLDRRFHLIWVSVAQSTEMLCTTRSVKGVGFPRIFSREQIRQHSESSLSYIRLPSMGPLL